MPHHHAQLAKPPVGLTVVHFRSAVDPSQGSGRWIAPEASPGGSGGRRTRRPFPLGCYVRRYSEPGKGPVEDMVNVRRPQYKMNADSRSQRLDERRSYHGLTSSTYIVGLVSRVAATSNRSGLGLRTVYFIISGSMDQFIPAILTMNHYCVVALLRREVIASSPRYGDRGGESADWASETRKR